MTEPGPPFVETVPPFVETVRIQNFGCAHDVTLELSRLHALIGPNDSGKTTVLHAIRGISELVRGASYPLEASFLRRARAGAVVSPSMGAWQRGAPRT